MNPDKDNFVWCAFQGLIDGDGYLRWIFHFVAETSDKAKNIISKYDNSLIYYGLHPNMTKESNWIHVGTRHDILYNPETAESVGLGGYVIEKQRIR